MKRKSGLNKDNELYQCDFCLFTCQTTTQMEYHMRLNHSFICSCCHRNFSNEKYLDIHLCEVHDSFFKVSSLVHPSYQCYVLDCHFLSLTNEERTNHMKVVHHWNNITVESMFNMIHSVDSLY
ncbi:hypothetical protein ENUP19_0285G0007 [Entamoeba nuttalli]|uniref:C2H2-type domain-containing protein n=1 Tax=Entamoeba nuttalli TaxID=412467 RepID=A0ABQ0DU31_9EUKA